MEWMSVPPVLAAVICLGLIGRWVYSVRTNFSPHTFIFVGLLLIALVGVLVAYLLPPAVLSIEKTPVSEVLITLLLLGLAGVFWEAESAGRRQRQALDSAREQLRCISQVAEQRARELEILSAISRELSSSLELRHVLYTVVAYGLSLSDADVVTLHLFDSKTGKISDYHVSAALHDEWKNLPPPRPMGLTCQVATQGRPAFIPDAQKHPLYADGTHPRLGAIASLPLRLENEVVGVINVGYGAPHQFGEAEISLLGALSDAAAMAVHNATLHEHISSLAVTDELTGLPNRRRFMETVHMELLRARRYRRSLSLMMIDLDNLKTINDKHGHAAGDVMLRAIADCLRTYTRETDLPARLGGDEFAVLLLETPPQAAQLVAERIRTAVERLCLAAPDGELLRGTVSIGAVIIRPEYIPDMPSFLRAADDALYNSKLSGRNTVTVTEIRLPPANSTADSASKV